MLLENRWNAGNGFTDWLEDATIFTDDKRELLQRMVVEKVHEWVGLLRRQPEESKAVIFVATYFVSASSSAKRGTSGLPSSSGIVGND